MADWGRDTEGRIDLAERLPRRPLEGNIESAVQRFVRTPSYLPVSPVD